jgi:hypothetical protein
MNVRKYISPPAAGVLLGCSRIAAYHRFVAGRFGPIIRHRGITYAELAAVEDFAGVPFTDDQLEAAVAGHVNRLITIPLPELETEAA